MLQVRRRKESDSSWQIIQGRSLSFSHLWHGDHKRDHIACVYMRLCVHIVTGTVMETWPTPKERLLLILEGNIHQQVPMITQLPFKDTVNTGGVRSWRGFRDCSPFDTGDERLFVLSSVILQGKKSTPPTPHCESSVNLVTLPCLCFWNVGWVKPLLILFSVNRWVWFRNSPRVPHCWDLKFLRWVWGPLSCFWKQ